LKGPAKQLMIDGEWVAAAAGESFEVRDPSTDRVLCSVARGRAADVDRAVTAARRAFDEGPWPRMNPHERSRLLFKFSELIEEHADAFAQLEALDNSKPVGVARVADVQLTIEHF